MAVGIAELCDLFGKLSYAADSPATKIQMYDLASLTKVVVTTTLVENLWSATSLLRWIWMRRSSGICRNGLMGRRETVRIRWCGIEGTFRLEG